MKEKKSNELVLLIISKSKLQSIMMSEIRMKGFLSFLNIDGASITKVISKSNELEAL